MGYSWYRVDSAFVRHPKTLALKAELQNSLADAYVNRLWAWTQIYAPSGHIPTALVAGLESELGWTGSAGSLAAALEKTGWLDCDHDGFDVHDWADLQGFHVKKARKDADKKRKRRERSSANRPRGQSADSSSASARTAPPTDVTDGRNERTDETDGTTPLPAPKDARQAEEEIFDHWRTVMSKTGATLFTRERREKVRARLAEGRSPADLKQAIDGCSKTPHNIGQNETGERWDDLELICRNGANVERFMRNAQAPPRAKGEPPPRDAPVERPEGRIRL